MSKKPTFSFDNLVDDTSVPDAPAGVLQRGVAAISPVMGRPKVDRGDRPRRLSVELDRATFLALNQIKGETGRSFQDLLAEAAVDLVAKMRE